MGKRTIIQISVNQDVVYALCSDGSLWARSLEGFELKWTRIDDVPQD